MLVGHAVKPSEMTDTEQKYGIAPKRGAGVVYQDEVVLMEHGDKAVKTWNANGIEWTLDGSDPQVSTLQEGQILFATSRCVGRVLKLTRTGSDVTVILGPVQLTDLIKQGNLAYEEPLDLNTLTAVQTPEFPGAFGSPIADQMKKAQSGSDPGRGSGRGGSDGVYQDVRYYIVSADGAWRPMRTIRRAPTRARRSRTRDTGGVPAYSSRLVVAGTVARRFLQRRAEGRAVLAGLRRPRLADDGHEGRRHRQDRRDLPRATNHGSGSVPASTTGRSPGGSRSPAPRAST